MTTVLFDEEVTRNNLLPLTFTRPVCEIRIGILTIKQKWELVLGEAVSYFTQSYLSKKFPIIEEESSLFINGKICPSNQLLDVVKNLKKGQALYSHSTLIAFVGNSSNIKSIHTFDSIAFTSPIFEVNHVWDIFQKNGQAIQLDVEWLTKNKKSQALSSSNRVVGDASLIFLEQGAKAEACIFNTQAGAIYIGKNAEVMEGSAIRGPFALGESSTIKLNAKIYGPTTIGPHCKVGGEVSNSVIFGYSNKAHDGFLGNSVIGEWCNLGADTNNSNLKNNYSNVKLFNYALQKPIDTGLQFCGLIMGDHSKSGINTMFNTGTVVGVGSNIFGGSFPATHVPSFSWGGSNGFETYKLEKLVETAERVFERRSLIFGEVEKNILEAVFNQTV
jgi:UDP-N-acetylglucosamine diphosphorylase/glucosamine-1-phosphate N-acetyltransferase